MQEETDIEAADLLYPDLATENYQVYYSPKYRWYFLSNHAPSELIVFKQADSSRETNLGTNIAETLITSIDRKAGVPHCSFYNPDVPEGEGPRESIEARALVYYDNMTIS